MRLVFSTTDHTNTDISDEQGNVLYTISTPSASRSKKVTTITKYSRGGPRNGNETMGVIEWLQSLEMTVFRFNGNVTPAGMMFGKRRWSTGLYFIGPDRRTYKWKLSPHCCMKHADSNVELVRFHKKTVGILKPAYLEFSAEVVTMLDHVILTFVYAESLRQAKTRQSTNNMNNMVAMNNMNDMMTVNNTNNIIATINMNNMIAMNSMNTSMPGPSC